MMRLHWRNERCNAKVKDILLCNKREKAKY